MLPPDVGEARLRVTAGTDARLRGMLSLTIRATALQDGSLPAVSETAVELYF
jgi:hypothetical protein